MFKLENYSETSLFPVEIWNQYENEKRTNNDCEGFNFKLSNYLKKHPNTWVFIQKIKNEETNALLNYNRIIDKSIIKRGRNKRDVERDLKIMKFKCEFLSNKYNLMVYLDNVANVFHEYYEEKKKTKN